MMANQGRRASGKISTIAKLFSLLASAGLLSLALSPVHGTSSGSARAEPSFIDPTATISKTNVHLGHLVYVAPFADIKAGTGADKSIRIGNESDVQDNCVVTADRGQVAL